MGDEHPGLQALIECGNVSFLSKNKGKVFDANSSMFESKALMTVGEYSMPLCHFTGKNIWILKPTSLNRGQGIHVANSFKKVKKLIRDYCRGKEI